MKTNKSIGRDLAIGVGISILSALVLQTWDIYNLYISLVTITGSIIGGQIFGKWWGAIIGVLVSWIIVFLLVIFLVSD